MWILATGSMDARGFAMSPATWTGPGRSCSPAATTGMAAAAPTPARRAATTLSSRSAALYIVLLTVAAQADPGLGFLGALSSRPAYVVDLLLTNFGVFAPAVENMSCGGGRRVAPCLLPAHAKSSPVQVGFLANQVAPTPRPLPPAPFNPLPLLLAPLRPLPPSHATIRLAPPLSSPGRL